MRRSYLLNFACKRSAVALALGLAATCLAVPAFVEGNHLLLGSLAATSRQ